MAPNLLQWRIVSLVTLTVGCVLLVAALWVDDTLFGLARRPIPAADRLEDRLSAGSWQSRSTDGLVDLAMVALDWQASMDRAALGDLDHAASALDELDGAITRLRSRVAGGLLHPDDQTDRTAIHEGLARIEAAIASQRAALSAGDAAAYVAAGTQIQDGLDRITATYGRGRP